jgi:hypothetical protein
MKHTIVTCEVHLFHFSDHRKGNKIRWGRGRAEDKRNMMEKGRKLGEWKKKKKGNYCFISLS